MAITKVQYDITRFLFREGVLPVARSLLEIGEANWYGDVPVDRLRADVEAYAETPDVRDALLARLSACDDAPSPAASFELAKAFYRLFFGSETVVSIDLHGTPSSLRHDLNLPVALERRFGIAVNNGTAEHIFFAGEVFRTMHNLVEGGGIMIHEGPLIRGWVDHGFYNFQPTLFFDLAAANDYDMLFFVGDIAHGHISHLASREEVLAFAGSDDLPANPNFVVLFQKPESDAPFRVPIQGYYAGTLSETARRAWHGMR